MTHTDKVTLTHDTRTEKKKKVFPYRESNPDLENENLIS